MKLAADGAGGAGGEFAVAGDGDGAFGGWASPDVVVCAVADECAAV